MADLTKILGGEFSPPAEKIPLPADVQAIDAMRALGLDPPDRIVMDGKIQRFRTGTKGSSKAGDKTGWYIFFGDGVPAGRFGCWRADVESTWRADIGRKLTAAEEMAHVRRMAEAKAIRDKEREKAQQQASNEIETIWSQAQAASPEHPYLQRKGIGVNGARVTGDGRLVVPLYSSDGELSSLQYIAHDGSKLYHLGASTSGKFWVLGAIDNAGPLYVAEGFATAATIHETTRRPCVIAYSASNLVPVVGSLREMYGAQQSIVVVADNDESGVGQRYAEQVSAKYGARMVMPPIKGDANDYAQAGHDLAVLLNPPAEDWLIPADDFSAKPAPISWIVKHWLQADALIMVHGPSGGGKTFVVLDWCLSIAAGLPEWCGHKVKPGHVVYLAGEGHHGLRGRIAAWKHQRQAQKLSMWLSKDGCDLNTPAGYAKVAEQIRALPITPTLIVVDTLHRFLQGDENSAQDAKTMLDACNALMSQFGCSVILVHHTGVSEEAQHRARGSSAWRGALDIEISVSPARSDFPMTLIQRKSKDAEMAAPVHLDLVSVQIPGWIDEDDQPVTSAVVQQADAPAEQKKTGKIETHRKNFEAAWRHGGREVRQGLPYVSRSAMMDYLTQTLELTESSAKMYIKPSASGKPICELTLAGIIEASEHGWIVVNEHHASAMMMSMAD